MFNGKRVDDDEPWDQQKLHLLELLIDQNQVVHEHNLGILDGIVPP